jgi:hypothetical protein
MNVSMDGMRRNLARAYADTVRGFRMLQSDCDGYCEIKEGLDDMRMMLVCLMCIYSDKPEDLMSNMANDADKLPFASKEDEAEAGQ